MGHISNNSFDYSNNSFNKSGPFEILKSNGFSNAPKLNFEVTLEFIQDLHKIKKYRAKKEYATKLKLLFVSLVSFFVLITLFMN